MLEDDFGLLISCFHAWINLWQCLIFVNKGNLQLKVHQSLLWQRTSAFAWLVQIILIIYHQLVWTCWYLMELINWWETVIFCLIDHFCGQLVCTFASYSEKWLQPVLKCYFSRKYNRPDWYIQLDLGLKWELYHILIVCYVWLISIIYSSRWQS